jgi:molybdopterin adenylyltransferase
LSRSTTKHKEQAPKTLNFAIFVCSTSRFLSKQKSEGITDLSGNTIEFLLKNAGHNVLFKRIIPDDKAIIEQTVKTVLDQTGVDAIVFCGGTGMAHSDVTIEAVAPFFEKTLPGFGEFFRRLSYEKIGPAAIMSRAVAGVAKGKAFFCIPGSPDAAQISVELLILPEAPHIVKHARE